MSGLEKRLARYPQLYAHVGFVHQFRVLSEDETRFVLNERWGPLSVIGQAEDWTSQETVTTIVRITADNVLLIYRLLMQAERILQIHEIQTVTKEVVEAARKIWSSGWLKRMSRSICQLLVVETLPDVLTFYLDV